jgi:hypothetical protein
VSIIGVPDLPLPGHGRTPERLRGLTALGRADLVAARLGEGHADAVAIRAELGSCDASETPAGERWGVWAAAPDSVRAVHGPSGWRLTGDRPWCSGADWCTHALVTAAAPDGIRLFAVTNTAPTAEPLDGTWPAVGMAGSDSASPTRPATRSAVRAPTSTGPASGTAASGSPRSGTAVRSESPTSCGRAARPAA